MTVSSISVAQSEGWKLVLTGIGVAQNIGNAPIFIKPSATLPTDDVGNFYKASYEEVENTDATLNLYARTTGATTAFVSSWAV